MPPSPRQMAAINLAVSVVAGTADGCFASSFMFNRWQARRESNPQPAVLETAALPIELLACVEQLLQDLGDDTGADGLATLADGEAQALFHRDRADQLHRHLDVVPGHDHLH